MTHKPNLETEPNAPDWSSEPRSDDLLVRQLKRTLKKPLWKRSLSDWRHRKRIQAMVEHLKELGFE